MLQREKKIDSLEEAKKYFAGDIYATEVTGIEIIEVSEGRAKVKLPLTPKHLNAAGLVMGAVYFTVSDFAFAVAANFMRDITVTVESKIDFLASAKGDIIFGEAVCLSEDAGGCEYEITVTDNLGTLVAKVTARGYRKKPK